MSHFLTNLDTSFQLDSPQYGVFVRVDKEDHNLHLLIEVGNTVLLDQNEGLAWLPEEWIITGPQGETIKAVGRFAITLHTHDPHHVVVDIVV